MILKLLFLLLYQDVAGERELMRVIAENFRKCRRRGIRSHMADLQPAHRNKPRCQGIFPESRFLYQAETDTYRCPAGAVLRRGQHHKTRLAWEYRAGQGVCRICAIRDRCTRSKTIRTLKRYEDQEATDEGRRQAHSREARLDRRRRRFLMEGSFADAANHHHFKRARWQRPWRQHSSRRPRPALPRLTLREPR